MQRKKTGKDKKQPSQEKTTEDKDDPKENLDEFFRNFCPGVSYFIAYTRTRECNPETIFALLHCLDNDVEVKTIDSRIKGGEEKDIATQKIARELFQVVKDHDNKAVKSLRNLEKLDKLMSNPACELFSQLQLDLDLIEVLDGKCLRISQRKFLDIPFTQQDFRYKSPCAYIPFQSTSEPDTKYFKEES